MVIFSHIVILSPVSNNKSPSPIPAKSDAFNIIVSSVELVLLQAPVATELTCKPAACVSVKVNCFNSPNPPFTMVIQRVKLSPTAPVYV